MATVHALSSEWELTIVIKWEGADGHKRGVQ